MKAMLRVLRVQPPDYLDFGWWRERRGGSLLTLRAFIIGGLLFSRFLVVSGFVAQLIDVVTGAGLTGDSAHVRYPFTFPVCGRWRFESAPSRTRSQTMLRRPCSPGELAQTSTSRRLGARAYRRRPSSLMRAR